MANGLQITDTLTYSSFMIPMLQCTQLYVTCCAFIFATIPWRKLQMALDSSPNDTVNVTLKNFSSNQVNTCMETLIEESAKTDCAYIICDALVKAFSFGR